MRQAGLATVGDDSVSYLVLAHVFQGPSAPPHLREWLAAESHYPPLFPAVLALGGATGDLRLGHLIVALFAVASLALVYAFAARESGRIAAGFGVALSFVLLPTAWITLKGILSETLYLFLTMAVLVYHQRLADRAPRSGEALVLGVLMAGACLTRVIGFVLVAAYLLHVLARAFARKSPPRALELLPLVPPVVLQIAWIALRPESAGHAYGGALGEAMGAWAADPAGIALGGLKALVAGWNASFGADYAVARVPLAIFAALGSVALAGTVLRAGANRLDAWYVALYLGVVVLWVFPVENRRFLYPLVPLLLVHAGHALAVGARRLGLEHRAAWVLGSAAALVFALVAPALVVIAGKARDRAPVFAGSHYSRADIREYFETLNVERARAVADRHIAVLAGLEGLRRSTPPEARIMWTRPDYVALLGGRKAVASYLAWDASRLAREIRDAGADYFVATGIYKADFAGRLGDPHEQLGVVRAFADPVVAVGNDFLLLRIDRARLERFIR